jgi:hypothetical protein
MRGVYVDVDVDVDVDIDVDEARPPISAPLRRWTAAIIVRVTTGRHIRLTTLASCAG